MLKESLERLVGYDKEVGEAMQAEFNRQRRNLELIASENYQSKDVLSVQASVFANKYAEGFPGRRYYWWQEFTDKLEELAIKRAKKLFNQDLKNIEVFWFQPFSIGKVISPLCTTFKW